MPIVLKHQAAGIAPSPENPRLKYGMTMALQQQRADQEMRQRAQDAQYDMQRMGAMGQARMGATREPSRAERREMLDMQIRNGAVPQGLIKPLRDLAGEEARIMRNRGLNAQQMGEALSEIDSQMDIIMSSAYPQRMAANRMQQAQANQQPAGPPTARVAFRKDPKLREGYMARAQATFEGAEDRPTIEMILDKAGELFDAEQRWLNADPAAAAPQGQGQPAAQPPNAPTAAPAANPQASFSGGQPAFGASPVMAQGGFQQGGGEQYDQSMVPAVVAAMRQPVAASPAATRNGSSPSLGIALAPGHPDYKSPPTPTDQRDEKGYVVMSDGSKVDPRDDFAMRTGGMGQQSVMRLTHPDGSQIERRPDFMMNAEYLASNAPVGQSAYQPTGSYTSPEVFGAANVLANTAQPPQTPSAPQPAQQPPVVAPQSQQQPEKKKGKRGYISIAPGGGQSAGQPAGQASGGWKSKSTGVYSPDGKFLGDPSLYDEAGANYIRQQAAPTAQTPATQYLPDGTPYNVNVVDMAYDAVNPGRSAGTNYFDPENPEYARMRGADPNIMNPPKNVGSFKGRYGLGGMDYGINPATGNRVTASVRPGGGLEYDEPTGGPRGKGGVTVMGGKSKPAPATQQQGVVSVDVSPGGTDVKAGLNAAAPSINRDDPRVQDALAVVSDTNATFEQQKAASETLLAAGITRDDVRKIVQATPPAASAAASPGGQAKPTQDEVLSSYELLRNNPASNRAITPEMKAARETLKAYGMTDDDIRNLQTGYPTNLKHADGYEVVKAYETVKNAKESNRALKPETRAAMETLKRYGWSEKEISNLRSGSSAKKPGAKSLATDESEGGARTPSPEGDWRKYSESTRRSGEEAPANPSLLGQLEQAESVTASPDAPSPTSDATQDQGKMRTWTNVAGKTFEGTLVEESLKEVSKQQPGQQTITVKRKDGQTFNIPVSQLSEEDIAYLEAASKVSRYLDGYDWTTGNTIKVGKGKASKYEKPATEQKKYPSRSGPLSKSYRGEVPEEVLQKPPSSSKSVRNRIS